MTHTFLWIFFFKRINWLVGCSGVELPCIALMHSKKKSIMHFQFLNGFNVYIICLVWDIWVTDE